MNDAETTPLNYSGTSIVADLTVRSDVSKKTGNPYTVATVGLNLGDDGVYPLDLAYLDERSLWALNKAISVAKAQAAKPSDENILNDV